MARYCFKRAKKSQVNAIIYRGIFVMRKYYYHIAFEGITGFLPLCPQLNKLVLGDHIPIHDDNASRYFL